MSELNLTHSNGNKVKLTTPGTLAANRTLTLPGNANGTIVTSESPAAGSVVQIVQFTADEQSITGGQATTKINSTFNPKFSGSKFNVSVFIPNCTSGDGQRLDAQVYLGTSSTPASNTLIIQLKQRMHGTSADDVTCISAQDFGGFTCSSTGTHYASLVLTPTQNTVVARHSSNANPTFIKLIVQEIAQ